MVVEIISWPKLYKRYVAGPEDQSRDLNMSRTAYPTDLEGSAKLLNEMMASED